MDNYRDEMECQYIRRENMWLNEWMSELMVSNSTSNTNKLSLVTTALKDIMKIVHFSVTNSTAMEKGKRLLYQRKIKLFFTLDHKYNHW